jgi:tellurite resistance protein TerC
MTALLLKSIKQAKRLIIAVIGFTVLLIGIAMIVLPGPAIVVIPIGLAILATEYVWARRLLDRVKSSTSSVKGWVSKQ